MIRKLIIFSFCIMLFFCFVMPSYAQEESPYDTGILTWLYNKILKSIVKNWKPLHERGLWLLGIFVGLELVFYGIYVAMGKEDLLKSFLPKVLYIFFIVWFMAYTPEIIQDLTKYIGKLGAIASGSGDPDMQDLTDPSSIVTMGLTVTAPILERFENVSILKGTFILGCFGVFTWFCVNAAFCVLAIQAFMALVELWIVGALSSILLPFTTFEKTSFIGSGYFKSLASQSIKLLVLVFVISLILPIATDIINSIKLDTIEGMLDFAPIMIALDLFAVLTIVLAIHAPAMAGGLVAGTPSLSAGQPIGMVVGAALLAGRAAAGVAFGGASEATGAGQATQMTINKSLDAVKAATDVSGSGGGSGATGSVVNATKFE